VSLKVTYQGQDIVLDEGATALIGSGDASTLKIARPGISRRHLAVGHDGAAWKVEDAGSRNGTFANGERVRVATVDGATTLVLGHPTEGEVVQFTEIKTGPDSADELQAEIDAFVLPDTRRAPAPVAPAAGTAVAAAATPRRQPTQRKTTIDDTDLTDAIRDQIAAIKGLTWSVWAMIAVTAALWVLTLFVGILGS
jgi:hypothetical protein